MLWEAMMQARLSMPWSQPTIPGRLWRDDNQAGQTAFSTDFLPNIPGAYPDEIHELDATESDKIHELTDTSAPEVPDATSLSQRMPLDYQAYPERNQFSNDISDEKWPHQRKPTYEIIPECIASSSQDSTAKTASDSSVIAVFGMTGTGKSSFIRKLTGTEVKVGHGLHSCRSHVLQGAPVLKTFIGWSLMMVGTSEIQEVPCRIGARDVTLVDTPGFGDTERSEAEILQMTTSWMMARYEENTYLTGVIYLHRISDPRMTESSFRNLRMLRNLCGTKNLSHVILATTMWDKVSEAEGARREAELIAEAKWWGDMRKQGAIVRRYDNTKKGATAVVNSLRRTSPFLLEFQRELGIEKKDLIDTAAGKTVLERLEDLQRQHQEDLRQVKEEIRFSVKRSESVLSLLSLHCWRDQNIYTDTVRFRSCRLAKTVGRDARTQDEDQKSF
jgi:GTP-binding protein EngB required for normal cell division